MGIFRLGHVDIRVPDLELATAYYTEVVGLIEVERQPERVYLKCWDEHDHHSVVLRFAPTYGLDHAMYKVDDPDDLDAFERRLTGYGCAVARMSPGEEPGMGEGIRFETPTGHRLELVHRVEKVGNLLPRTNPPPAPLSLPGIHPPRIDHLFLTCEDVDEATSFFTDVLDFRLTEQLMAKDGHRLGSWLERSHSPHDLALMTGPQGGLHHFAFWLDDWNAVRTAADILAFHGVKIDMGPTRHGITRGYTIYFFDPVGNRNEVFTGGYWHDPDAEPITWTEDQMGRAIFYYEGAINEGFLAVHS
jgi:catechol 2,3-dioxygenase